ncbi:uncharacterized protein MEPE_02731 [Melanopsichium pennsylvanicum]|uniref:Uncharacterized protein n=2 Tax=Melanopsichium pennsylvanicum TaxID=63383 RepID=A0AAJ4XN21_9BASI|nr:conserved hypothetical protein [Melanopsichium pennsylvanicum 4]SNX84023.1 uncharacterized protein MEPE_02731 [Melanopsichium pennsylvanicum]
MEPALPLPLRLQLAHDPVPMEHFHVSDSISSFLTAYAARTGTHNAAAAAAASSNLDGDAATASASGSTGGVVAAQLTRLMNGLQGKIDYAAFSDLISSFNGNNTISSSSYTPSLDLGKAGSATAIAGSNGGGAHTTFSDDDNDETTLEAEAMEVEMEIPAEILESTGDGQGKESFSKNHELVQAQTPTFDDSLTQNSMNNNNLSQDSSLSPTKKSKKDKKNKKVKKEA